MKQEKQQLEALQDIRKMMKDSSKFISLSGLSGVFAGIYALAGAYLVHQLISDYNKLSDTYIDRSAYFNLLKYIFLICAAVLICSVATAFFMSNNKAKRTKQSLFDHTSKKVLWNMLVPLATGGLFCIALLIVHDATILVSPVMLLFYGLALFNSSKYTMSDIKYLGYFEIGLGLLACFLPGFGLLFWALGFGVLHIIYGAIMWFKYDRNL